jgi:hypothetical protein
MSNTNHINENHKKNLPEDTQEYAIGTEVFFISGTICDFDSNDIKITVSSGIIISVEKYRASPCKGIYIRYKTSHEHTEYYGNTVPNKFNTIVYHNDIFLSERDVIEYLINNEIKESQTIIKDEQDRINRLNQYLNQYE